MQAAWSCFNARFLLVLREVGVALFLVFVAEYLRALFLICHHPALIGGENLLGLIIGYHCLSARENILDRLGEDRRVDIDRLPLEIFRDVHPDAIAHAVFLAFHLHVLLRLLLRVALARHEHGNENGNAYASHQ